MRHFGLLLIFILLWTVGAAAQNAGKEKKIVGEASLLTNYVWHGLTQTKRNPAIQSSMFYYLADVFRVGLWGSNVSYYHTAYGTESKANALLKIYAEIMLEFSPNFGMDIIYSDNRYFESDDRDGNTFTLNFGVFGYDFGVEQEGNWQGTVSKARYYYAAKTFDVFGGYKWENKVGYTMFEELDIKDYFDIKTGIGTKWGFVMWQLAFTTTTNNEQFGDYADHFFTFSGTATF